MREYRLAASIPAGIALSLYNTAAFEEFDGVDITSSDGTFVPSTPGNLIYRTAKEVYALCGRPFHGLRIVQTNPIPMARGLGSSSACIAAGIRGRQRPAGRPAGGKGHPDVRHQAGGAPGQCGARRMLGGFVVIGLMTRAAWSTR